MFLKALGKRDLRTGLEKGRVALITEIINKYHLRVRRARFTQLEQPNHQDVVQDGHHQPSRALSRHPMAAFILRLRTTRPLAAMPLGLGAGDETESSLTRTWRLKRHEMRFTVDISSTGCVVDGYISKCLNMSACSKEREDVRSKKPKTRFRGDVGPRIAEMKHLSLL